MTKIMFDSVNTSQLPVGDYAYAGYVNGSWATYSSLAKLFPGKQTLSIAVSSSADADCLDIENGDATNDVAAAWVHRQIARGIKQPVLYTSVSNVGALLTSLSYGGILRNQIRIWCAHYGIGEHICGPTTCKRLSFSVDGTQWTSTALNKNLDQSLLTDTFFNPQGDFGVVLDSPIIAIKRSKSGGGYWLVSAAGGVYAFGDAMFYGGMAGKTLNKPIVDMAVTLSGLGYWLVAADGGIFAYGDAVFHGSIPGLSS